MESECLLSECRNAAPNRSIDGGSGSFVLIDTRGGEQLFAAQAQGPRSFDKADIDWTQTCPVFVTPQVLV